MTLLIAYFVINLEYKWIFIIYSMTIDPKIVLLVLVGTQIRRSRIPCFPYFYRPGTDPEQRFGGGGHDFFSTKIQLL